MWCYVAGFVVVSRLTLGFASETKILSQLTNCQIIKSHNLFISVKDEFFGNLSFMLEAYLKVYWYY